MFKCQQCHETSKPGEKSVMKVVETASVVHEDAWNPKRREIQKGGQGTQIVRELRVHVGCQ